jgi:hypothetical protein
MSTRGEFRSVDAPSRASSRQDSVGSSHTSDERIRALRIQIQELAGEVNSHKAKTGAAFGGAVFLVLLCVGAAYDLARGNVAPWLMLGLDRQVLTLIAWATGAVALTMMVLGLLKLLPESRRQEARLAELEREYDALL